jgi:hypothetical protein
MQNTDSTRIFLRVFQLALEEYLEQDDDALKICERLIRSECPRAEKMIARDAAKREQLKRKADKVLARLLAKLSIWPDGDE